MSAELREHYAFRLEGARGRRVLTPLLARMVAANNERIARVDGGAPNPRPLEGVGWADALVAAGPTIRAEWDRFVAAGGVLPRAEELFDGDAGQESSWWRMGLLLLHGRPVDPLGDIFPATARVLASVPGIDSATWSVLGPGGRLAPHTGPNAGGLRLLVAVDCPGGAHLDIAGTPVVLGDGDVVLFDDTAVHSSDNPATAPRTLVLCDVIRPLPRPARWANVVVQRAHHALIPRFRGAPARGRALHRRLNPGLEQRLGELAPR